MWFLVRQHKMNAISSVRLNLAAERQENLIVFLFFTILYYTFYYMEGLHFCYKESKTLRNMPPPPHMWTHATLCYSVSTNCRYKAHLRFCNPDLVFSQ